jgi:hypothetical protein
VERNKNTIRDSSRLISKRVYLPSLASAAGAPEGKRKYLDAFQYSLRAGILIACVDGTDHVWPFLLCCTDGSPENSFAAAAGVAIYNNPY